MLGLEALGGGKDASEGWLPLVPGLGPFDGSLCWAWGSLTGAMLQATPGLTYARFETMWKELQCKLKLVATHGVCGPIGESAAQG